MEISCRGSYFVFSVPGALPGHILPPLVPTSQPPHIAQSMSVDASAEPPAPPPRPHQRSLSVDYKGTTDIAIIIIVWSNHYNCMAL